MTSAYHEEFVTLAFRKDWFQFAIRERIGDSLHGFFRWTDDEKRQLLALLEKEDEDGRQPWYLDDDGFRLDDEKLFQKSPWSIVDGETRRKVVQRMMDCDTGEAWFCFTPWFRIGDELNLRPPE